MPISILWDNAEKTVIQYHFEGRWTWDEFHHALAEGNAMMDSVDHTVHVIVNMQNSMALPRGAITHIANLRIRKHRRIGVTILIGASQLIQAIHSAMITIYPGIDKNFKMLPTLEEARAALEASTLSTESNHTVKDSQ
jgi:hypothetical protein